jgi:hypothetical protein
MGKRSLTVAPTESRFTIVGVIGTGLRVLFRNVLRFLAIVALIGVPLGGVILFGIEMFPLDDPAETGFAVATMQEIDLVAFLVWTCAALIFLAGYTFILAAITVGVIRDLRGAPVTIRGCLAAASAVLLKASGAMLIYFIVMLAGLAAFGWGAVGALSEVGLLPELGDLMDPGRLALTAGAALASLAVLLLFPVLSSVVLPAIVAERVGSIGGYRRSFALTKGRRWALLALVVLSTVATVATSFLAELIAGTGAVTLADAVDYGLSGFLAALGAAIAAVAYHRLRGEKEGGVSPEVARVFD